MADPVSDLSRRTLIALARRIKAAQPEPYADYPLGALVVEVRELVRFAEQYGIDDPALQKDLVLALFRPAPQLLTGKDAEYVTTILAQGDSDAPGRVAAIRAALGAA